MQAGTFRMHSLSFSSFNYKKQFYGVPVGRDAFMNYGR